VNSVEDLRVEQFSLIPLNLKLCEGFFDFLKLNFGLEEKFEGALLIEVLLLFKGND